MAMPKIAARHQPHDMRFRIAMAPSAMTRITAIGVSQARMLVCRAVAPVINGEPAACASASSGIIAGTAIAQPCVRRSCGVSCACIAAALALRRAHARGFRIATRLAQFTPSLARGAEADAVGDEGMVVLALALLVGPSAGAYVR